MMQRLFLLFSSITLIACGGEGGTTTTPVLNFVAGSGVVINDPTADPFLDADVADVVVQVDSVASDTGITDPNSGAQLLAPGGFLDVNQDGAPDTLFFPEACSPSSPPGCGFPRDSTNFDAVGIPLNFRYRITINFRDSAGTPQYVAQTEAFDNIANPLPDIAATINQTVP